jgi:hypothetical protein
MAQRRRGSKRPGGGGDNRRQGRGRGAPFRTETKVWHDPLMKQASGRPGDEAAAPPPAAEPETPVTARRVARIIAGPKATLDPAEQERLRLLGRIVAAVGRPAITRAVDDWLATSRELPLTQAVWLQVLEHHDESRVAQAIETLHAIIAEAAVVRRAVLESRLRRIEELAEERTTRDAAAELRRFLQGRPSDDDAPVNS